MYKKFFLLFTLLVSNTLSKKATFKVISFGSKTQVKIEGGKTYNLTPVSENDILHKVTVDNVPTENFRYFYIVDGKKETFYRTFDSKKDSTFNDFYGRKHTTRKLKTFKHPEKFTNWNRSIGKTTLFDDSYIPTVHITGGANVEKFFTNPRKYRSVKLDHVKFYLKNSVESFTSVATSAKNIGFTKFQMKFKLGKNDEGSKSQGIKGRYVLKLRNGSEDPLNLRQLIYGNIIQALGMPSLHSIMVRVYYNKKPVGFYTLQETVPTNSFIRSEFYGDPKTGAIKPPKQLGYVLDGTTGADFEYKPNDMNYYGLFASDDQAAYPRLIAFCQALSKLNPKNKNELKEFESKWFDIDTFHKAMAMEYLTGDWDGYWYTTSNYAFYDDPLQSTKNTFKYYFITQDHDETFGVGLTDQINKVGKKFPELSYTTMLHRTWHIVDDDAKYRTLVDKFIGSTPELQKRFHNTLISIVQNIFNPVAFRDVVGSYYNRYNEEVKWDYSFTRPYKVKQSPDYKYEDFVANFEKGVGGLQWGLYEWVQLRAESIKRDFCITWEGDANPPSKSCVPKVKF